MIPGFEVSNRVSLLKSISRKVLSGRSNKASETLIDLDASGQPQPKGKPRRTNSADAGSTKAAPKNVHLKKTTVAKSSGSGQTAGRGKR